MPAELIKKNNNNKEKNNTRLLINQMHVQLIKKYDSKYMYISVFLRAKVSSNLLSTISHKYHPMISK